MRLALLVAGSWGPCWATLASLPPDTFARTYNLVLAATVVARALVVLLHCRLGK